jgi:7,8-dihydroneopterin aldolase/epimerase/oxygenase
MWRFEDETIYIENLRVQCIVGVRPFERQHEQPLLLSIAFPADFAAASASGALADTVDYSAVAGAAKDFVREGRFELLETLARELGRHLCERFALASMRLRVRKPLAISDSDGPAVSLTVRREAP